jgi:hypothetical protein
MMKADWSDDYKRIAVHGQDVKLQWFSWLGKYFAELFLVFGTASSVGNFDRPAAKLVLRIVLSYSQFPACTGLPAPRRCMCAACSKGDAASIYRLERVYAW